MEYASPQYGRCIANLACSVLKYYGIQPPNPTLPEADELLSREYRNVVVLLLDGMGRSILERHLAEDGFFRSNLKTVYSSVFPPTTTAATTSMDCGLYPAQHCWLGWTGYFKEVDKNVIYFRNKDNDDGSDAADYNVAWRYVPYVSVRDRIAETGAEAHFLAPFMEPYPKIFPDLCAEIRRLCRKGGRRYIYAYWDNPDTYMHDNGVDGRAVSILLRDMEYHASRLSEELSDTLLIITADHGHINIRNKTLADCPDITECLVRMPSMETRALNLFVKEGMEKRFEEAFGRHFGEEFRLMTRAEVLSEELLGKGGYDPRLTDMLGDYLAAAVGDTAIQNTRREGHRGSHAGLTKDELEIPLIAIHA